MIRKREIPHIANCPICGEKPVLRRNASKKFQVYCVKCKTRTSWMTKPEAIIQWYNHILKMSELGYLTPKTKPASNPIEGPYIEEADDEQETTDITA